MEDYRKLAKIEALDRKFPGPVCSDPRCRELCAEAYDTALSLRLDPLETIRRTVERELHCLPAEGYACRFGFIPAAASIALGRKKEKDEVVHIFRTGGNECKECQALKGTQISPEVWADKEEMKDRGFWKQKNGEYLPHPNCKCHWEERSVKSKKGKIKMNDKTESDSHSTDKKRVAKFNKTKDSSFTGKEVEFYVKDGPKKFENVLGFGYEVDGFKSLLEQLEDNYPDHSIGNLRIIGHGGFASTPIGEKDNFQMLIGLTDQRDKRIISRLKRMLSSHSLIEFRMCNVGAKGEDAHDNGPDFAQRLANLLGCRVKVYLEPVTPYGWRPIIDRENEKIMPENFGQRAEFEIYAPQP